MSNKKIIKTKKDLILTEEDLDILDEETENTGVIYCITNTVNNKKYYGQTKSYRVKHGKIKYFGAKGRFNEHILDAQKNSEDCPKLYNAIRKYGKDAFTCEQVLICHEDNMSEYETYYIVSNNTVKLGYNVITRNPSTPIGLIMNKDKRPRREKIKSSMITKWATDQEYIDKTTKANLASLKKRSETGENRTVHKDKNLPGNIYKNPDGGYDIRVIRNGEMKITSVTGKNKTDEELLELAIIRRDKIIDQFENQGIVERVVKSTDHNGDELPQSIVTHSACGSNGYKVKVLKGNRCIERSFLDKKLSMDKKLELAKEMLEHVQNNFDEELAKVDAKKQDDKNGMDHLGNKLPPGIRCCKGRYSDGYTTLFKINGKKTCYSVTDKEKTMTEKLNMVKEWLEEKRQLNG